ncbi:small GTP-binding protein, putative [Trichomonas vaginalis G3]|uniref:Small GTP-binding protein, putative n=1 Tax=Trichomonas vaginalis (strain ATCC PRA-98 / G3) TaxID=412133 RepID=A2FVW8_TRIV3|nr:retrograde vesicle-mediated transport, Golgi to ER [Trichomonas vaginalis G3]EAX90953.1 small GTP-binding protein, putative [Trichomonas vaginalis G3]KAI5548655.1 retrograde vesicle-mediated transport, Golgi to ER [Trichomonas vaginalis G3]|eukprot:XP_001303883.1 small GTP-binding protein [Trichomonas vaginalis G3]
MKICETVPEGKVIVVGCAGVGKTSIINMYTTKSFASDTQSTIAATYVQMRVLTERGEVVLNLWDTAGQERFKSLIPMYSRNSSAAIIVTDLTNHDSLVQGENWYKMVKDNCPISCKVYIVANKVDLPPGYSQNEFEEWAKSKDVPYFFTSAKQHETVVPLFQRIADDLAALPTHFTPVSQVPKQEKEKHSECC